MSRRKGRSNGWVKYNSIRSSGSSEKGETVFVHSLKSGDQERKYDDFTFSTRIISRDRDVSQNAVVVRNLFSLFVSVSFQSDCLIWVPM